MRMLSVGMILSIIFYIGSYLWVVVLNIKTEKYKNLLFDLIYSFKKKEKEVKKEYFEIFMENLRDYSKAESKIESLIKKTRLKKDISLGLCLFSLIFQFILIVIDKGEENLLKTNGSLENIMILILIIIIFGIFLLGMENFYKKTIEIFLVICFAINISLIWKVEKKPLNDISPKVQEKKILQGNIIKIINSNNNNEGKIFENKK